MAYFLLGKQNTTLESYEHCTLKEGSIYSSDFSLRPVACKVLSLENFHA